MFRTKKVVEYLQQSDYKDHSIENYPDLVDSGYAPIVLDYMRRNKLQDSPYLSKIEDTTYVSKIYLLALLLGKEGVDLKEISSNEKFELYKSLEGELVEPLISKYPALESVGNKSKELLYWFATTYESCSYMNHLYDEEIDELVLLNKLSLYNIKSSVRSTARMIKDIQDKFPNLRFDYFIRLAVDEWDSADLPVLINRFAYYEKFHNPDGRRESIYNPLVSWPVQLLNASNCEFAIPNDRLDKILTFKKKQSDLSDMLISNANNKLAVNDDNAKSLAEIAQVEDDVLKVLSIQKSLTWGPKESEFDKINEKISTKVSRYFNKPAFPTPFDIATFSADRNLLTRRVLITDKQVTVGEDIYAVNENNIYHFIDSANEVVDGVSIRIESICYLKLENVSFNSSKFDEVSPLSIATGSTVECIGNVSLTGSSYSSAIRPIPNKEDEFLYIKGDGTLTVSGGSHAPAIGYAARSQSYGRWTQDWVDKVLKIRIENLKVITKNVPTSLGIGIYSTEGETTVDVVNADTSDIIGYGADLIKACRWESGSTKMSSPMYIADLTELKKALTEADEAFEDHYVRYGGPSKDLIYLAINKEDNNLLNAIEHITVDDYEYEVQVAVDHPMFESITGCPNLGAQTRKQYVDSSISSDASAVDL